MSAENISYDLKRFAGIKRDYTDDEVERLRGSIKIDQGTFLLHYLHLQQLAIHLNK